MYYYYTYYYSRTPFFFLYQRVQRLHENQEEPNAADLHFRHLIGREKRQNLRLQQPVGCPDNDTWRPLSNDTCQHHHTPQSPTNVLSYNNMNAYLKI